MGCHSDSREEIVKELHQLKKIGDQLASEVNELKHQPKSNQLLIVESQLELALMEHQKHARELRLKALQNMKYSASELANNKIKQERLLENLDVEIRVLRKQILLKTAKKIEIPQGATILELAKKFVSQKHYDRVLLPVIADWRDEYIQAVDEDAHWLKYASIRARNIFYFAKAMGALGLARLFLKLIKALSSG